MSVISKSIAVIFIFTVLLTFGCQSGKKEDSKTPAAKPPAPVSKAEGYIVTPKLLSQGLEVPGSLAPYAETELHPEVSGRVTAIYFKEGSYVNQGAMILKIYDGDLQAQLKKLQVQLKVAEQTAARYEALLKIGGVSQQEYDMQALSVNTIKADMNIVSTSISKTSLRAPFSGKLGLSTLSIGAYITPATVVATLRKVSQLKLSFTVPEKYGPKMKIGNLVHFSVENNPTVYTAKITATENNITEENRSLNVNGVVVKPDAQLIAGAFARVQIPLGENDAALMIPTQAIIPEARNKKVIAVRNGLASMEVVTLGTRDSAMVEITSGLKAGDTVLISGLLTTKPGSKVQINKISKN